MPALRATDIESFAFAHRGVVFVLKVSFGSFTRNEDCEVPYDVLGVDLGKLALAAATP